MKKLHVVENKTITSHIYIYGTNHIIELIKMLDEKSSCRNTIIYKKVQCIETIFMCVSVLSIMGKGCSLYATCIHLSEYSTVFLHTTSTQSITKTCMVIVHTQDNSCT